MRRGTSNEMIVCFWFALRVLCAAFIACHTRGKMSCLFGVRTSEIGAYKMDECNAMSQRLSLSSIQPLNCPTIHCFTSGWSV